MMERIGVFTSGQLGKAAGLSADAIRHYEKLGLLARPLRSEGGYRLYPHGALHRVLTIRKALKAGFSLAELAGIFKERDSGGAPCRRVAMLAQEKISSINNQISDLTALRSWLAETVKVWNIRLEATAPGTRAGLLESLVEPKVRNGRRLKGTGR